MDYVKEIVIGRKKITVVFDNFEEEIESIVLNESTNLDTFFISLLRSEVTFNKALMRDLFYLLSVFSSQIESMNGCNIKSFYDQLIKKESIPNSKNAFRIRNKTQIINQREVKITKVALGLKEGSMTRVEFKDPDGIKVSTKENEIIFLKDFNSYDGISGGDDFETDYKMMNIPIDFTEKNFIEIEKDRIVEDIKDKFDVFESNNSFDYLSFFDLIDIFAESVIDYYSDYESMIAENGNIADDIKDIVDDFNKSLNSLEMIKNFKLTSEAIFTINMFKNNDVLLSKITEALIDISDYGESTIKIDGDQILIKSSNGKSIKININ